MTNPREQYTSRTPAEKESQVKGQPTRSLRRISVYDAVAGRAGLNGFLTEEQKRSENLLPLAPEEILLNRRSMDPELISHAYNASDSLPASTELPESEMLKAIHTYASDFYSVATAEEGKYDFRSLDETALIAIGVLMEEAVREALGENGDMVMLEPEGLGTQLDETNLTRYQIKGTVKPARPPEPESDEGDNILEEDESPMKKQRR